MSMPWYALQLRPQREQVTRDYLMIKGYDVFLPMYYDTRCRSGRMRSTDRPLFPGYLFCQCRGDVGGTIVTTPGVIRIVSVGGIRAEIPEKEITRIRQIADSPCLRQPWRYVPDGTLARIETGPLKSIEGILACGEQRRKLIVSMRMLQRSIAVMLDDDTEITILRSSTPAYGPGKSGAAADKDPSDCHPGYRASGHAMRRAMGAAC